MKTIALLTTLMFAGCGDFDQPDTSGWPPSSDFCGYTFHHCGWDGLQFCKGVADSVSKQTCVAAEARFCKADKVDCLEKLEKEKQEALEKAQLENQ